MATRRRYIVLVSAICCGGLATFSASAQNYPDRPIRIIVPYPAGGGADIVARLVASRMTERLGQAVTVENRAGATGMVGTAYVARATPDGYTLLFAHADTLGLNLTPASTAASGPMSCTLTLSSAS